jgi:hypothetical protein
MQSYEDSKMVLAAIDKTPEALAKRIPGGATHSVIGRLPNRGDMLTIHGLHWIVEWRNEAGVMRLRLETPA